MGPQPSFVVEVVVEDFSLDADFSVGFADSELEPLPEASEGDFDRESFT
ncbi:MAG: hypothetical protein ACRDWH_05810 [Acidimicrobiia bacterium]